ncbi:MAG: hypothetical protein KF774_20805 [Planctomyces sp.]|nr:hypothetical protein [Planctomyces sp.]
MVFRRLRPFALPLLALMLLGVVVLICLVILPQAADKEFVALLEANGLKVSDVRKYEFAGERLGLRSPWPYYSIKASGEANLTPDVLESLRRHRNSIARVELVELAATDEMLSVVSRMTHLKDLTMIGFKREWPEGVTLDGLRKLTYLTIRGVGFTDVQGRRLNRLPNLSIVDLRQTRIGDETFTALSELRSLYFLKIEGTRVTDEGCLRLASRTSGEAFPSLKTLFADMTAIGDASVPFLASLPNLRNLRLESPDITDAGVRELLERSTSLASLDVAGGQISGVGWALVPWNAPIESLGVDGTQFTGSDILTMFRLHPQLMSVMPPTGAYTPEEIKDLHSLLEERGAWPYPAKK